MNKKRFILLSLGLVLIFAVLLINNSPKKVITNPGNADWTDYYEDEKALVNGSELICVGTVTKSKSELRNDLVFTQYSIKIDEIQKNGEGINKLKGNHPTIKVLLTGGEYQNFKTNPFEECPLLEEGEQYLLFLKHSQEGHYLISGGYQGIATIENNIISFRNNNSKKKYKDLEMKSIDNISDYK